MKISISIELFMELQEACFGLNYGEYNKSCADCKFFDECRNGVLDEAER